ncbi:Formamidopyrimidine-DNA glycosylase [Granulibacter bethesdensis]|uniref:Formamidopyrimidine-DNA glycosylase n=2 Tax=Granulibacter bethesdensis TaxID=364410 RepID=A0AAN0VES0_9PROT|nr:Formamidopyrimidine-DNA glycosylase [Granulibacter bethesdensis]APH58451.1 Formamidopyrimidine-DNA glycosylase [Granulibacter bethesdensis]
MKQGMRFMPELPEVETVMRGLRARLEGRRIVRAEVRRPDLRFPLPPGLAARLTGAYVRDFRRRGKYILMRLEGGDSLLIHLGMSGRFVLRAPADTTLPEGHEPERHEHVSMMAEDGWIAALVDPRRFGMMDLVPTAAEDAHRLLSSMGPEPLEDAFCLSGLEKAFAGRRTAVKLALLDQRIVAGLGNIYVSEALFRAGINPLRAAGDLSRAELRRLIPAIRETLTEAIAAGGSSLRDYVQPDGELGYFQHAWKVYGRAGQPCEHCPGLSAGCQGIVQIVQGGRSTYFCPCTQQQAGKQAG